MYAYGVCALLTFCDESSCSFSAGGELQAWQQAVADAASGAKDFSHLEDLLATLLCAAPDRRASATEALRHPFLDDLLEKRLTQREREELEKRVAQLAREEAQRQERHVQEELAQRGRLEEQERQARRRQERETAAKLRELQEMEEVSRAKDRELQVPLPIAPISQCSYVSQCP